MADMGFLPQVEWLLRHVDRRAPDAAVLGHPRRRHRPPRAARTSTTRCATRSCRRTITVDEMTHRFLLVHEMDKVKVLAAIARQRTPHAGVRAHQAGRRPAGHRASRRRASTPPPSTATSASATGSGPWPSSPPGRLAVLVATDVAARGLHIDDIDVVVHYDPPQDSQGLPAPLGPHRPRRRERRRGHARAVERGARGAPAAAAPRPSACRSCRCSPTTPAWPTWPAGSRRPTKAASAPCYPARRQPRLRRRRAPPARPGDPVRSAVERAVGAA